MLTVASERVASVSMSRSILPWSGSLVVVLSCGALLGGCDSGGDPDKRGQIEVLADTALAAPTDNVTLAARSAEQGALKVAFAKKKAEDEAAVALVQSTINGLVGLPGKLPRKIEQSCDGLVASYDQYQRRTLNDDGAILKWVDNKRKNLGERRMKCMAMGSIKAAACQSRALDGAPDSFGHHGLEILTACVAKYAAKESEVLAQKAAAADRAAAGG